MISSSDNLSIRLKMYLMWSRMLPESSILFWISGFSRVAFHAAPRLWYIFSNFFQRSFEVEQFLICFNSKGAMAKIRMILVFRQLLGELPARQHYSYPIGQVSQWRRMLNFLNYFWLAGPWLELFMSLSYLYLAVRCSPFVITPCCPEDDREL